MKTISSEHLSGKKIPSEWNLKVGDLFEEQYFDVKWKGILILRLESDKLSGKDTLVFRVILGPKEYQDQIVYCGIRYVKLTLKQL